MACTLSNKCAKNLSKRTVLLQLIIKNVVTCFFWNIVYTNPLDMQTDMHFLKMSSKKAYTSRAVARQPIAYM